MIGRPAGSWILVWLLFLALAGVMAMSAVRKLSGAADSLELRDRLGVPLGLWRMISLLEGLAALGLLAGFLLGPTGVAAAAGVAVLMAGAVVTHLRRGITGRPLVAPAVLFVLALAAAASHAVLPATDHRGID